MEQEDKKKGEKVVKLKKLSEPTCCDFLYIYVCVVKYLCVIFLLKRNFFRVFFGKGGFSYSTYSILKRKTVNFGWANRTAHPEKKKAIKSSFTCCDEGGVFLLGEKKEEFFFFKKYISVYETKHTPGQYYYYVNIFLKKKKIPVRIEFEKRAHLCTL